MAEKDFLKKLTSIFFDEDEDDYVEVDYQAKDKHKGGSKPVFKDFNHNEKVVKITADNNEVEQKTQQKSKPISPTVADVKAVEKEAQEPIINSNKKVFKTGGVISPIFGQIKPSTEIEVKSNKKVNSIPLEKQGPLGTIISPIFGLQKDSTEVQSDFDMDIDGLIDKTPMASHLDVSDSNHDVELDPFGQTKKVNITKLKHEELADTTKEVKVEELVEDDKLSNEITTEDTIEKTNDTMVGFDETFTEEVELSFGGNSVTDSVEESINDNTFETVEEIKVESVESDNFDDLGAPDLTKMFNEGFNEVNNEPVASLTEELDISSLKYEPNNTNEQTSEVPLYNVDTAELDLQQNIDHTSQQSFFLDLDMGNTMQLKRRRDKRLKEDSSTESLDIDSLFDNVDTSFATEEMSNIDEVSQDNQTQVVEDLDLFD
ncbi:MAG: hypothetical protein ACK5G7_06840 [Erysipelotrichaceae bacterium]